MAEKEKRFDVACVGILCADVLAKPVEKLPDRGKLDLIQQLQLQIGGCASNAAIDLAKLGVKTTLIGKIGRDGFGRYVKETLLLEKVDVAGLKEDAAVPTSASVVTIGEDGERSILHCLGTNAVFTVEDINLSIIQQAKILLIAGTFLMPSFDGRGTEQLLKAAQKEGVLCCMDTAWDASGQWMRKIENTLAYLDWFLPSYEEAVQLSGCREPQDIAETFIIKGVRNVVIKLGKDGCYVKPENRQGFFVPTYTDIQAVDTSGAGDSFCAGFLTGLTRDWDLKQCARFANAVGTHCVMEIGTTAGIRPMEEILAFMRQRDGF